jgi:hypothetical protein
MFMTIISNYHLNLKTRISENKYLQSHTKSYNIFFKLKLTFTLFFAKNASLITSEEAVTVTLLFNSDSFLRAV